MFCARATTWAARSRASPTSCGSPVTTARTAAIAASRKVVGSFPGIAVRIDSSIKENGSVMRVTVVWATVSAVEPTALETLPSAFVMTATTMCGSGGYAKAFEGAYFSADLAQAHAEGRIGNVSADPILPLRAFVDIGGAGARADAFALWIVQWVGHEIRVLD